MENGVYPYLADKECNGAIADAHEASYTMTDLYSSGPTRCVATGREAAVPETLAGPPEYVEV